MLYLLILDSSQPCISPLKNTPSKDAAFDNCRKNYSSNFSSFREFPNVVDWPYLHCTLNNRGGSTVSSIFIIPTKKSLILAQKLERIIILGRIVKNYDYTLVYVPHKFL